MVATIANTVVGKVGNVYITPYGTAAPFTIPPSAGFDIGSATLSGTWTGGNLGYIHESDTPTFSLNPTVKEITAWQLGGNVMRTLQTQKIRSMKFTVREINKVVWSLVEPGTTYLDATNGSSIATVPNASTNPNKAGLFEIQDLDLGVKMWIYVPLLQIKAIGDLKFANDDTANAQLTFNFASATGLSTDPLYYVATNHPGLF